MLKIANRSHRLKFYISLWVFFALNLSGQSVLAKDRIVEIGRAVQVGGEVYRKGVDSKAYEKVQLGGAVWLFDKIITKDDGKIKIIFLDGSSISVRHKSALQLTRYIYDPKKSRFSSLFDLVKGGILATVSKHIQSQKKNSFEIETKNTVAGVRGSKFSVSVKGEETQVFSIENPTYVQSRKDGKVHILQPRQTIVIHSKFGKKPPKYFTVKDVEGKYEWKVPVWVPPEGFQRSRPREIESQYRKNIPEPWVRSWRPYDFPKDRPLYFRPPGTKQPPKEMKENDSGPEESKRSGKKVVAVVEFSTTGLLGESYWGRNVTEYMTNLIPELGHFEVVERSRMMELLGEKNLNEWGLVNNPKQAQLYLGADYLIAGGISKIGNTYSLSARLINTNTTRVVAAKTTTFTSPNKMKNAARIVARSLGEKAGEKAGAGVGDGPSEFYLNVDSKRFVATIQDFTSRIRAPDIRIKGQVLEINHKKQYALIKLSRDTGIREGIRLQVMEEGFDGAVKIAEVVVDRVKGRDCFVVPATGEFSALDMGMFVQSDPDYRYIVAVGYFKDLEENDEKLIEAFRDKVYQELEQASHLAPAGEVVRSFAAKIKPSEKKEKLKKLFEQGVDFYIDGEFSGTMGQRGISATVWTTFDGERYQRIRIRNTGI